MLLFLLCPIVVYSGCEAVRCAQLPIAPIRLRLALRAPYASAYAERTDSSLDAEGLTASTDGATLYIQRRTTAIEEEIMTNKKIATVPRDIPKTTGLNTKILFRTTSEQKQKLARLAKWKGKTLSSMIREIINKKLSLYLWEE